MGDASSWASNIIAAGSLVVSVIALVLSLRAHREANVAQRRIVEIEEQREQEKRLNFRQAGLQPELRKTGQGSYRLYLVNGGMAEARKVRVTLDGKPLAEHGAAVRGDSMPLRVGPGAEVSCLLGISLDCAPPFEVEVQWDDDSGTGRTYRTTLTF